ncbi:hypothetical protein ACHQM5_017174 [Ranunculus cassubicifolius]
MTSSSPSPCSGKICYNPDCHESKLERSRKGWRLRTGDFAQLCDRCGSAYQEERFCELFHMNAAGWRNCESCTKPLHCGCIVSIHTLVLKDAGGIECMACARKHSVTASNQSWSQVPLPQSVKNKNLVAMPNGINGQWWHHTVTARSTATSQSELCSRMPYEIDRSNGIDKLISAERQSLSGLDRNPEDPSERAVGSNLELSVLEMFSNNNVSAEMVSALNALNGSVDARKGVIAEPVLNTSVPGVSFDGHRNLHMKVLQSPSVKDPLTQHHGMVGPYAPSNEANCSQSVSGTQAQRQIPPLPLSKQLHADSQIGVDSSAEAQTSNGKVRGDARGRNQLLPRYWPKITDQELQQISGDSNLVVTPLFEKILSASDAGRIGRLVLPKKCAEAYFPTISQPEGLPLRVQDAKGMEWVFQFRFWPNNNSRMYVLEGVTPCIQNMQLQAGDTVTFSRLDPDGKLVMGFRKTSNSPLSNQVNFKEINTWSEVDKSGYIAKDAIRAKTYLAPSKRKSSVLGSKSKRLQIENEDLIELQLTWEEAQGLFRPPPNQVSKVFVDDQEFEEYEESPILGKPIIFTANSFGENFQWAQCDECSKWRKLPVDACLPLKWTCSDNTLDPKRSSCLSEQELTDAEVEEMVKKNKESSDAAAVEEGGLDTLANLAILAEVEAPPPTTKHPRHRPGCTCIVCIQPPSGKGPKHSDSCVCNVCLTVRRRFRTLMERRGKRTSPPENAAAESSRKKQPKVDKPPPLPNNGLLPTTSTNEKHPSSSPLKVGIDLNIRPERDEEPSPVLSGSGVNTLRFKLGNSSLTKLVPERREGIKVIINHVDDETNPDPDPDPPLAVWGVPTSAPSSG